MNTRDYEPVTSWRSDDGMGGTEGRADGDLGSSTMDAMGSVTANALDLMVRMPLQVTAAGLDWMSSGMQRMGQGRSTSRPKTSSPAASMSGSRGSSGQGAGENRWSDWISPSNWTSAGTGTSQDLNGGDLKYLQWTVVFTKPGHETVLEPLQSELINYSTEPSSFAALKIARCLDRGRFGKLEKPALWAEHGYPPDSATAAARRSASPAASAGADAKAEGAGADKGWRIPAEDQKYVQCLYRVEWRLPKQEPDPVRVERVTIERTQ